MATLLFAIIILGIAVAGIAIKMFFIKGATFKKVCSSGLLDPKTGKPMSCSCGEQKEEQCDHKH